MKWIWTAILSTLAVCCFSQSDEARLEKYFRDMPGVQFAKVSKNGDPHLIYSLKFRQPLDHSDTGKGYFFQSAHLIHKGFAKPMVMETEGYEMRTSGNEIEKILEANDINIEHRYFGNSKPDSLQWEYVTCEQVGADLHHINQLMKKIYKNKWISTGISRGGQLAIYYKYLYPSDVDLSIPYVAPFTNHIEDKRIYQFLDTMGSDACRKKIFEVQQFLLEHEKEAVDKLKWYALGRKLNYTYFGNLEKAFEFMVLEYPFAFWQLGSTPCDSVPTSKDLDLYLKHLVKEAGIDYFSDKYLNQWVVNGYMAHAQLGYYGYDISRFSKSLKHINGENPSAALVPKGVPIRRFDSSFTQRVIKWLNESGHGIFYIDGSRDTWSACRVIVPEKINSKNFLLQGANHFEARIKNMNQQMRSEFKRAIQQQLNLPVNLDVL